MELLTGQEEKFLLKREKFQKKYRRTLMSIIVVFSSCLLILWNITRVLKTYSNIPKEMWMGMIIKLEFVLGFWILLTLFIFVRNSLNEKRLIHIINKLRAKNPVP